MRRHDRDATLVGSSGRPASADAGLEAGEILPVMQRGGVVANGEQGSYGAATATATPETASDSGDKQLQLQDGDIDVLPKDGDDRDRARAPRNAVRSSFTSPPDDTIDDHTHRQYVPPWLSRFFSILLNLPLIAPIARYLSGPSDVAARRRPRLWRIPVLDTLIEPTLFRWTRWAHRPEYLYVFLLAWFLGFTFLARAAWYNSTAGANSWIDGTTTYWGKDDACGLNGENCGPFEGFTASYRCPSRVASTQLLNYRTIGDEQVIFQPLVVGGGDEQGTYRADSFLCAAAVHRGLFSNSDGGCLSLQAIGNYTNFLGSEQHGIPSVPFDSDFPFAYRFIETSQRDCKDLRADMLAYSTVLSTVFGLVLATSSAIFYWVSVCMGYWHVTLASDPRDFPPDLADAFGTFLPCLFICYAFWRFAMRWVFPAFNNRMFERTIWFYGPFWVFLLSNYTFEQIPIDRLTASDIRQQAGGIAAVVVLVIVLVIIAINQIRVIRVTGWLPYYLGWYILGGIIIAILSQLPGLELRIHHYIAAMAFIPATAFPTRLSLVYQGILLGLFLNGAARWGFDSILQTPAQLRRDAPLGSDLPAFAMSSIDVASPSVSWSAIPANLTDSWDGFALLVNDVLRYTGSGTNYSLAGLRPDIPYYFRLAYQLQGSSGDFTKAAVGYLNGTWVAPAAGPS